MQRIHSQRKKYRLQQAGKQTAANKRSQFQQDNPNGPIAAMEYKSFIRHKCKQYRNDPCDHIAPGCIQRGKVIQGKIDQKAHNRCQSTKKQIRNDVYVLFYKTENTVQPFTSLLQT